MTFFAFPPKRALHASGLSLNFKVCSNLIILNSNTDLCEMSVIDVEGYRLNVGIILCNQDNELLWARRVGQDAWQFPQGGIMNDETPKQAMFRELYEEVGLKSQHVDIVGSTQRWLKYDLPKRLIRYGSKPLCIGQKQMWFLLRLTGNERDICLNRVDKPEFDHWRWVDYWHPISEIVSFKKQVYETALHELAPLLFGKEVNRPENRSNI